MFKIIACINKRGVIGNHGKLLYSIKNDMKNFKSMTIGNVVIMGRYTFESITKKKPLKDRINIIITKDNEYNVEASDNVFIVHSISEAVELTTTMFSDKEWFVIGGSTIYRQFLDEGLVDEMRLTYVDDDAEGNVKFPMFNTDSWYTYYESLTQTESYLPFTFRVLKKK